jgi:hypothetical protein
LVLIKDIKPEPRKTIKNKVMARLVGANNEFLLTIMCPTSQAAIREIIHNLGELNGSWILVLK